MLDRIIFDGKTLTAPDYCPEWKRATGNRFLSKNKKEALNAPLFQEN